MTGLPKTDFHLHATRHRAVGANEEADVAAMMREGARIGLDVIGVIEHLSPGAKHPIECLEALAEDFRRADHPMPAFLGSEVNVEDDGAGSLYGPPDLRERLGLDYVIAAVHRMGENTTLQEYLDEQARWLMEAATGDNDADVIAHPWHTGSAAVARGLVEEWRFALVPETFRREFMDALAAHGKALEVNSRDIQRSDDPAYRQFVTDAVRRGVRVAVGSDCHGPAGMDRALAITAFLDDLRIQTDDLWMPEAARERLRKQGRGDVGAMR